MRTPSAWQYGSYVEIPIRVKFEFEVREGVLIADTLSFQTLYNKKALQKRYPQLNLALLENAIETTVNEKILKHIKKCGFLKDKGSSDACETSPNSTWTYLWYLYYLINSRNFLKKWTTSNSVNLWIIADFHGGCTVR